MIFFCVQQKFADEIVHMIGCMGAQLKKQVEGLEELTLFTYKESSSFRSTVYPSLLEQAHQALAKVSLAVQWLGEDLAFFSTGVDQTTLRSILLLLEENKIKVNIDTAWMLKTIVLRSTFCLVATNAGGNGRI